MRADFFDLPLVQHHDLIGGQDRRKPVRDRDYGPAGRERFQRLLDLLGEMAAIGGGRPHESSVLRRLHFYRRRMTRHTLPFTAGHLHPRVGPPLIIIERLSHRIGALTVSGLLLRNKP